MCENENKKINNYPSFSLPLRNGLGSSLTILPNICEITLYKQPHDLYFFTHLPPNIINIINIILRDSPLPQQFEIIYLTIPL